MSDLPACPRCGMENTYPDGASWICPDCAHEWPMHAEGPADEDVVLVRDVNGQRLSDGDTVLVIKDLKVKGSSIPLKQRSEEHTSELQSHVNLVCRLLL